MQKSNKNGISVVIVNWNTKDVTAKCLSHLKKAIDFLGDEKKVEVVLVDNDSSDGSVEMIEKEYPWVKLVKAGSNLGYAKGNNLGFSKTNDKNKYLLLLNSDVYLKKGSLAKSLDFFGIHADCDVLGCKLVSEKGELLPSAGNLPTPLSVWSWFWGLDLIPVINKLFKQFHPRDKNFFRLDKRVGWVQGAYLFMKREVFEKTNGFDETIFMYMDEVEWGKRVANFGYNIYYTPSFSVAHLERSSARNDWEKISQTYFLEAKGLIYYLRKHNKESLTIIIPLIKIGAALRYFAFWLLGNKIRRTAYAKILKET